MSKPSGLLGALSSIQSTMPSAKLSGGRGLKWSDGALVIVAVFVIALMVLPVPGWALDTLISINIGVSIVILLFSLYVATPVAFSSFPTVLLFTTLFRVSLSIAATRQILLNAHAGDIIETFGKLIVGGSLIVGLVVFFIITIVQFIVVAKGAERVAEVAARFTLDALPGKQMAIDSDMRSGLINQRQASQMRDALSNESQFFGAMDGAMKFVKGDAVASIIVVAVNLIGGIAVGTLNKGMPLAQAISTYAVLSIGDGLVSQVPALFATMAAGVVVTRTNATSEKNLAVQIGSQLASQPKALWLAGLVIALFSFVPGFPALPFVLVGVAVAAAGFSAAKTLLLDAVRSVSGVLAKAGPGASSPVAITPALNAPFALVAINVHTGLAIADNLRKLDREFEQIAARLQQEIGVPFPGVFVRTLGSDPPDHAFQVFLSEIPVTPMIKISEGQPDGAAKQIAENLERILRAEASQFVGIQETKWLVSRVETNYPDLVREATAVLPLARLSDLLSNLVKQGVPIVDVRTILETAVRVGSSAGAGAHLEFARIALCRSICYRYADPKSRKMKAILLSQECEDSLLLPSSIEGVSSGEVDLNMSLQLAERLGQVAWPADAANKILLVSPQMRSSLCAQLQIMAPDYFVTSHAEIQSGYGIDPIITIESWVARTADDSGFEDHLARRHGVDPL
jgi:type III secretion protein V